MHIELIFEHTCPNINPAREQLRNALTELSLDSQWQEWDVADDKAPDYIHGYGSPTILINGKDVITMNTTGHDYCCRVYRDANGNIARSPTTKQIMDAITHATDY
ncbi:MAG: hypothetical protein IME93_05975 [Proteobacteria bacterium]|nr:hypothetical protein [Pseudomonadota bacterium]